MIDVAAAFAGGVFSGFVVGVATGGYIAASRSELVHSTAMAVMDEEDDESD